MCVRLRARSLVVCAWLIHEERVVSVRWEKKGVHMACARAKDGGAGKCVSQSTIEPDASSSRLFEMAFSNQQRNAMRHHFRSRG